MKLSSSADTIEEREDMQRDQDKHDNGPTETSWRFTSPSEMCYTWVRAILETSTDWEKSLRSILWRGTRRFLWIKCWIWVNSVSLWLRKPTTFWPTSKEEWPAGQVVECPSGQEVGSALLLCPCETPSAVLHPQHSKDVEMMRKMSPAGGHKDDQRAAAHLLW